MFAGMVPSTGRPSSSTLVPPMSAVVLRFALGLVVNDGLR